MNELGITNETLESAIEMVGKYGKPTVVLMLGLYGINVAREVALKAIESKTPMSVGCLGFTLALNSATNNMVS